MSTPFNEQIELVMAEFQEQRARLESARQELEKATVTATSKDHLVTVTASVSGEVREIKFHRTDYAAMAPAELSAVLVETITKAREKAGAKATAAFGELAGFGAGLRDSLAGGSELDEIFGLLQAPVPSRPAAAEEDFDG